MGRRARVCASTRAEGLAPLWCTRLCTAACTTVVYVGVSGAPCTCTPLPSALSSMLMCSLLSCTLGCTIAVHTHTLTPHCALICVLSSLHTHAVCTYPCTLLHIYAFILAHFPSCALTSFYAHPCTLACTPLTHSCTLTPHGLPLHTHPPHTVHTPLAHPLPVHPHLHTPCTLTSHALTLARSLHTHLVHTPLMHPHTFPCTHTIHSPCTLPCTLTLMPPPQ